MTNTEVEYMYRDGSNYKQYGRAVFEGELTEEQVATIWANTGSTWGDDHFLPAQVGLEVVAENFESHYDDDHPWHELISIEPTESLPTEDTPAAEWFEQWVDIQWDVEAAEARFQEWVYHTPQGH